MGFINKIYKKAKQHIFGSRVRRQCASCGSNLKVNYPSNVGSHTVLGNNINFNGMNISGGRCTIGNNFHSGRHCQIINQNHNYEGEYIPYDGTMIYKEVVIDDNVWLGNNVIILGNVHIGEGAIIQAGAVVVTDIPKCAIAGGNPAKVFKYRDVEHYERLKTEEKFW